MLTGSLPSDVVKRIPESRPAVSLAVGPAVERGDALAQFLGAVGEVGPTVTVGGAEPVDRAVRQSAADGALSVGSRGPYVAAQFRSRPAEQVVEVPVARLAVAGGEFVVAVDPGEPPGTEGAAGVGVPSRRKPSFAEGAHPDGRRFGPPHQ